MREWTTRHGALLVLDEVITFRTEHGGLQQRYDFTPDMTAMGKMIGGGFPIGAVAGRAEVMEVMNPRATSVRYPLSGTFSANPISMTAGLVAMELFDPAAIDRLSGFARTFFAARRVLFRADERNALPFRRVSPDPRFLANRRSTVRGSEAGSGE